MPPQLLQLSQPPQPPQPPQGWQDQGHISAPASAPSVHRSGFPGSNSKAGAAAAALSRPV